MHKCPNCGAILSHDETIKNSRKCEYCNTTIILEEEKQEQQPKNNETPPVHEFDTDFFYSKSDNQKAPRRPRLKLFVIIFLLFFNFVFALIYIFITKAKQHEWDRKWGNK